MIDGLALFTSQGNTTEWKSDNTGTSLQHEEVDVSYFILMTVKQKVLGIHSWELLSFNESYAWFKYIRNNFTVRLV